MRAKNAAEMVRPFRSVLLLYVAKVADIAQGQRRRPKTFDDLRALGLLEPQYPRSVR